MESHCLKELSVFDLLQDAVREGNKQMNRSWKREGCGKNSASMLFRRLAMCIVSQQARGPWESPASSFSLFRHNSNRLQKQFCLKQNHGWEIRAHQKMIRYVQMHQCTSHSPGFVLKTKAKLWRNKKAAFCNYRCFWVSLSPPFPSFNFRFSSQNNNTFCQ